MHLHASKHSKGPKSVHLPEFIMAFKASTTISQKHDRIDKKSSLSLAALAGPVTVGGRKVSPSSSRNSGSQQLDRVISDLQGTNDGGGPALGNAFLMSRFGADVASDHTSISGPRGSDTAAAAASVAGVATAAPATAERPVAGALPPASSPLISATSGSDPLSGGQAKLQEDNRPEALLPSLSHAAEHGGDDTSLITMATDVDDALEMLQAEHKH